MIEINLLPDELRKVESTPPARMLAIVGSIIIAFAMGFFIVHYHMVDIPKVKDESAIADTEIKALKEEEIKVKAIQVEIDILKSKVTALDNLKQSRIRFARVLDRLCAATPDGVWFRTFNVVPDVSAAAPGGGGVGKRYQIALTGYATGNTQVEMSAKLTDLMNRIRKEFSVRPDGLTPPNASLDYGFSKFINAKFDAPNAPTRKLVKEMPAPIDLDPKAKKNVEIYKQGLDFNMTVNFEMPAPKT